MRGRSSRKALEIFRIAAPAAGAAVSALLIILYTAPVLFLRGSVDLDLALTGYSLKIYGDPWRSPAFEYVTRMSWLCILAATAALGSSALELAAELKKRLRDSLKRLAVGVFTGSSLALLTSIGILQALLKIAVAEVRSLTTANSLVETSAGTIAFPPVTLEITPTGSILLSPTPLFLATLTAALATTSLLLRISPEATTT